MISPRSYDQIKHNASNRFYHPNNNNKFMENLEAKQLDNFWEVKIFGWFTHIGLREHISGSVEFVMALCYAQYNIQHFNEVLSWE